MRLPPCLPILFVLFAAHGAADTLWVPDDHATIQAAIDAAEDFDEVVVRPGTYVETIDFAGKWIAVRSEHGPAVTVLDGARAGSVVTFANGEGAGSVLEGFTITNGAGTLLDDGDRYGGGIFCLGASPMVRGNVIRDNGETNLGGGGGIAALSFSFPFIEANVIEDNDGGAGGGGLLFRDDSAGFVRRNLVHQNEATNGGGLLCRDNSHANITENRIVGNRAQNGAGIGCFASSPQITGNLVLDNVASGWVPLGGGIGCWDGSSPFIGVNVIAGNRAEEGAGVDCRTHSSPFVLDCTITGNVAEWAGAGLYAFEFSSPTVLNTIFWDNQAPGGFEISLGDGFGAPTTLTISYSDVQGGHAAVGLDANATLHWGAGMIDADPLFVDAAHGDYRLRQDPPQAGVVNPCVDAGDPSSSLIAGTTRTDWVPDVGAMDLGFHYLSGRAWAIFRTDAAGANAEGYAAAPPVLGTTWHATVDHTGTGHFLAGLQGFLDPLESQLPATGEFLLVDPRSPGGELLHLAPAFGYGVVPFARDIPLDLSLTGFTLATQAASFGGASGTTLHNAIDLHLGD